jgi:hypothetical protein
VKLDAQLRLHYDENLCEKAATPSGAPSDNSLPVVFEATEDPTLNNMTRSDVNCDKTGTCYDGILICPDFNAI